MAKSLPTFVAKYLSLLKTLFSSLVVATASDKCLPPLLAQSDLKDNSKLLPGTRARQRFSLCKPLLKTYYRKFLGTRFFSFCPTSSLGKESRCYYYHHLTSLN